MLSNSGHIAGIVNPPSPKSIHRVLEAATNRCRPIRRIGCCGDHPSDDLVGGLGPVDRGTSGAMRKPPRMGSRKYRPIIDAPGTYVLER